MPAPPRILLADCDAMFCAVARLVDPDGAGQAPLLIVGGRRGGRGVVCSASYEARAFGVRSGMPIRTAERLCPEATFVPVPRKACGEKSREVRAVLEEWAPVVEPASIDEFYLDMSGTEAVYRHEPLEETARRIRSDVLARTGITVSVGGGTNRLVAKLAVERAKPTAGGPIPGVHLVPPGEEEAFLRTLDLAAIPGIGPKLLERLRRYNLTTVAQAVRIDEKTLVSWTGPRTGAWLYRRLRGIASSEVSARDDAKSVSREETFPEDLSTDDALETELLRLVVRVGHDLRSESLEARTITVKLRDFDFRTRQASRTLPAPVTSDRAIHQVALELFHRLRAARTVPARLLGVGLSQFGAVAGADQLDLLGTAPPASAESPRDRTLSQVVDRINARYGGKAIGPGRLAGEGSEQGEGRGEK